MKRRLIVPLDGSEASEVALIYAEAIPSAEVALLVCLPGRDDLPALSDPNLDERARRTLRDDATGYLERMSATLERQGRRVEQWVETGDPADRIVANATANDLIIMTTHGFGAGRRAVFGSVTDRVVRHSHAPVLVVRGGDSPIVASPITRIVVPLDGSDRAEAALPIAEEIARDLDVPLHLVRALDVELLRETVRAGTYAAAAYAASIDEIRAAFRTYLDEQAGALTEKGLRVTTETLDGPASKELIASLHAGDLVVMTSHGRSGVRRWMLGSVAEKLIRLAPVPVLVSAER